MSKTKQYLLIGVSTAFLVALITCFICDYFTSHSLSWSLIVLLSLAASWLIAFVLLTEKEKVVQKLLIAVSVITVPFLWLLSLVLHDPKIFSLGACIAFLSIIAVWSVYALAIRYRGRMILIIGLAFLISIPFTLGITHFVTYFSGSVYTDIVSDIFHAAISLILAGVSFTIDYIVRHHDNCQQGK